MWIYEWIDGSPISSPTKKHLNDLICFVRALKQLVPQTVSENLGEASEACLCFQNLRNQINQRKKRLEEECCQHPRLSDFFENNLNLVWD